MANTDTDHQGGIYTEKLKAGKRTYFFDVREARNGEYYITMSEVAKKTDRNGNPMHLRNKLFLYKEDLDAFLGGLQGAVAFIRDAKGADYGAEGRVYNEEWAEDPNTIPREQRIEHRTEQASTPKADPNSVDYNSTDYKADFTFDDL